MRPAERPSAPAVLIEHAAAWCQEYVARRAAEPGYRFQWKQHQGQRMNLLIGDALAAMTQAHCAYCDGFPLDDTACETIDHFLPKSRYPELVYAWENLYLACPRCQREKEINFDGRVDPVTYRGELLRPDEPGYRFERYFLFNYENGHIEPNPGAPEIDKSRACYTIDSLGLNQAGRPQSRKRTRRRFARRSAAEDPLDDWPYRFLLEVEAGADASA
jgi:uncharacterized protein (TIGR02646 family)